MKKTLGIGISAGAIAGIMAELSGPIQMPAAVVWRD